MKIKSFGLIVGGLLALFLASPAYPKTAVKADTFTRDTCDLPSEIVIKGWLKEHYVKIAVRNNTEQVYQFEYDNSSVQVPDAHFQSAFTDNFSGRPVSSKYYISKGDTYFTFFPTLLILETDAEESDVRWRPLYAKEGMEAVLFLYFRDQSGKLLKCELRSKFVAGKQ